MSNKDLTRELKQTIKELAEEKEELLRKLSSKESRIKQILIQLENSTDDVTAGGKKIREQEDQIKDLSMELDKANAKINETKTKKNKDTPVDEEQADKPITEEEQSND